MLKRHNFFDVKWHKSGSFRNAFRDNGDGTVTDYVTGLVWQKSGSEKHMNFRKAQEYIENLAISRFAGHSGWRLPTIEELASLLESSKTDDLYIDRVFVSVQRRCWSSDKRVPKGVWGVYFVTGEVCWRYNFSDYFVRVPLQTDFRTKNNIVIHAEIQNPSGSVIHGYTDFPVYLGTVFEFIKQQS
ncbi:MAG: DUF1566 domain-containing protein [Desulfobacterales bacterium]|nr:DUF1566 domain-containing protein [Desulfobacterales bacterium]